MFAKIAKNAITQTCNSRKAAQGRRNIQYLYAIDPG